MKKLSHLFIIITLGIFGILFYVMFLKSPVSNLYCKKQVDLKIYNFRQTVRKNGADELVEENADIQKFLKNIYNECLQHEFSQ